MTTPTKEELGLPWGTDENGGIMDSKGDQRAEAVDLQTDYFIINSANTYHEREQLLRECCDSINLGVVSATLVDRLNATLTPPSQEKA